MAETLIATAVLGQETRIPIEILAHPRHMLINMATIKAVLQTLTRIKSTLTRMTRVIQPAQAYNPAKSMDIMDRSRIRTMTMTIVDPEIFYQTQ